LAIDHLGRRWTPDVLFPETSGLSACTLEDLAGICEKKFGNRMHLGRSGAS
jgi:hypothetical protein